MAFRYLLPDRMTHRAISFAYAVCSPVGNSVVGSISLNYEEICLTILYREVYAIVLKASGTAIRPSYLSVNVWSIAMCSAPLHTSQRI